MIPINSSQANPFIETETRDFPEAVEILYPLAALITTIALAQIIRFCIGTRNLAEYQCDLYSKNHTVTVYAQGTRNFYKIWDRFRLVKEDSFPSVSNSSFSDKEVSAVLKQMDAYIERHVNKRCQLILKPVFGRICHQWECDNVMLRLFEGRENRLIWKAYFKSTGEILTVKEPVIHIRQNNPNEPMERKKDFQRTCFKHFKKTCLNGLRVDSSYISRFSSALSQLELTCILRDPDDEKNLCIHFLSSPVARSKFDRSVRVDSFHWAVTLVREGGIGVSVKSTHIPIS